MKIQPIIFSTNFMYMIQRNLKITPEGIIYRFFLRVWIFIKRLFFYLSVFSVSWLISFKKKFPCNCFYQAGEKTHDNHRGTRRLLQLLEKLESRLLISYRTTCITIVYIKQTCKSGHQKNSVASNQWFSIRKNSAPKEMFSRS